MAKAKQVEAATTGSCPMCKSQSVYAFRPFCSRRCADLDLARWLKGNYAIPGQPAAPHDLKQDGDDQTDTGMEPDGV